MNEFEAYKVFSAKHWTLYIDPSQPRLGQVYLWANRVDAVDLTEVSQEEYSELLELIKKVRTALTQLFTPDLFNYASLGNKARHLHVWIIPRYKDKRTFEGVEFTDRKFGEHYEVDPPLSVISPETLEKLKQLIRHELSN